MIARWLLKQACKRELQTKVILDGTKCVHGDVATSSCVTQLKRRHF